MAANQDREIDETIIQYTADLMAGLNQVHFPKEQQSKVVLKHKQAIRQLIEAEATRRELALLDELDKSLPRKTERVTDFIEAKRQALKKGAE